MTTTMLDTGTTRTPATDASAFWWTTSSPPWRPTTTPTGTPAARPRVGHSWPWPRWPGERPAALGAEAGVTLTGAAGVVVQRELAAAARLLDEAAGATNGESWEIADPSRQGRAAAGAAGRDAGDDRSVTLSDGGGQAGGGASLGSRDMSAPTRSTVRDSLGLGVAVGLYGAAFGAAADAAGLTSGRR